jgi:sulfate permease, SulP family
MLLVGFYLTDFQLVAYIPKPAFSSLLVLSCMDMMYTWLVKSYLKTKEKMEWIVVPLIVILSFVFGLLGAIFVGVALSTFLFVAAFFRSGVVKYIANGVMIRSTIERSPVSSMWLDSNGALIQILVLQNYLFFGNASSVLNYIASMFEDPSNGVEESSLVPKPRIVILDMSLVTGMDTSAVDVFADILNLLSGHDCKLFLSGLPTRLREVLKFGGVQTDSAPIPSKRKLRLFATLDGAIGKAEDSLLESDYVEIENEISTGESGFRRALRLVDELVSRSMADASQVLIDAQLLFSLNLGQSSTRRISLRILFLWKRSLGQWTWTKAH